MLTSVNATVRSHVISASESVRVYRFNGSVLTDVRVDGKWVTICVA